MDEADDPLAFLTQEFRHTRKIVEDAFAKRDIPLRPDRLVAFSMSLEEPPVSSLYAQHSAPVEAVRAAAQKLRRALMECDRATLLPVRSNERNVAAAFGARLSSLEFEDASDLRLFLDDVTSAAEWVLRVGPMRRRGRPPELVYDAFVASAEELAIQSGHSIEITRREGAYFGAFIGLVCELEQALPSELRAGSESAVAERIMAARERRGEKG